MGKKLVHGVGINDAGYPVCVKGCWCPKYVVWKTMMARAYGAKANSETPPTSILRSFLSGIVTQRSLRGWKLRTGKVCLWTKI